MQHRLRTSDSLPGCGRRSRGATRHGDAESRFGTILVGFYLKSKVSALCGQVDHILLLERESLMDPQGAAEQRYQALMVLRQQIEDALASADSLDLPIAGIRLSEAIDITDSALISVQIGPNPSLYRAAST
jgi:hypothetical protein